MPYDGTPCSDVKSNVALLNRPNAIDNFLKKILYIKQMSALEMIKIEACFNVDPVLWMKVRLTRTGTFEPGL